MTRTRLALAAAYVVLTVAVVLITLWLRDRADEGDIVNWLGWGLAVLCAYAGLALIGWWVRARERGR